MATKRIAVPTVEKRLAQHFGHCEEFALVDVDLDSHQVVNTEYVPAPAHQPGLLPRWLAEQNAHVIIAGGMGRRAQALFQEAGVEVVVGAPAEGPETIAQAYLDGTLDTGANLCDH